MAHLSIKSFSCIEEALVELKPLTVLIGPQASGKSVISKLIHFFYQCIINIHVTEYPPEFREVSLESYSVAILEEFRKRFPPQAWGPSGFELEFSAGPITIKIYRGRPRKNSSGNLRIEFSEFFQAVYSSTQERLRAAHEKSAETKAGDTIPPSWTIFYSLNRATQNDFKKALGDDYVGSQLFIPAGRSFFTGIGKAIIAFEHGGFLDPLTITFGKFFLTMRESLAGRSFFYRSARAQKARLKLEGLQAKLSEELFSGKIKVENDKEFIESPDGRRIPFSFMSSGQQELLPLWLTVNQFFDGDSANHFVYIEEPEAHLFPSTQGIITEYLITLLATSPAQKMLITTHSPYMLGKINNLLKAGALAGKVPRTTQSQIEKIIRKAAWLKPKTTAAYAITERRVVSILGEDGLIDGDYLDEVSSDISRSFNELLEIEYQK